jgi:hypothetical protein
MIVPRSLFRLAVGAAAGYLFAVRPWHLRWGADDREVHGGMAGDDLVRVPQYQATRAITIDAPPASVWAWLIQLGAYTPGHGHTRTGSGPSERPRSSEWPGATDQSGPAASPGAQGPEATGQGPDATGHGPEAAAQGPDATGQGPDAAQQGPEGTSQGPGAAQQGPEAGPQQGPEAGPQDPQGQSAGAGQQGFKVGDVLSGAPDGAGFVVEEADPPHTLVLAMRGPDATTTCSISLRDLDGRTRMVVRVRIRATPGLRGTTYLATMDVGDFLAMRRQMLTIKERAENLPHSTG